MINNKIIKELNTKAFGIDIDRLELFLNAYKYVCIIEDMNYYYAGVANLISIFKEIKPESVIFKKSNIEFLDKTEFDELLDNNPKETTYIEYETNTDLIEKLFSESEETLIGWDNAEGLDVSCVYINGGLYRIYVINGDSKMLDITDKVRYCMPEHIDAIDKYRLVDIRGRITLSDCIIHKNSNVPCEIIMTINNNNCNKLIDKMMIVCNDIFIKDKDTSELFKTQWDKFEYLNEIGVNTVNYVMLRDITPANFDLAINEFSDYFNEALKNKEIKYGINTVMVSDNQTMSTINICKFRPNPNDIFNTVVRDIRLRNNIDDIVVELVIDETHIDRYNTVNVITLSSIAELDDYDIDIGKKINFRMISGEAVIC